MKKIHTHYDNLKVSRNAPSEVIRAAYKALAQKYHPDKNLNDNVAAKNMAIINESFKVLSDAVQRRAHDIWIVEKESTTSETNTPNVTSNSQKPSELVKAKENESEYFVKFFLHMARHWVLYGFSAILIVLHLLKNSSEQSIPYARDAAAEIEVPSETSEPAPSSEDYAERPPETQKEVESTGPDSETYSKVIESSPITEFNSQLIIAPNGEAWPITAGYVKGYKKLNTKGLSSVTVDNSQNSSNVFVKLVSLRGAKSFPVRQFFIPAYSKFTVNKVTSGNYDVRYKDLNDGSLSRSESFNLKETSTSDGVQFSNITMTLYQIQNGNMQTYSLSETDF